MSQGFGEVGNCVQTSGRIQRRMLVACVGPSACLGPSSTTRESEWGLGRQVLGSRGLAVALGAGTAVGCGRGNPLTGPALAESTQATDPTSARILAAKRLSLNSPTSR